MLVEQATVRGRSLALNGVCGNLGVALAAGITAVLAAINNTLALHQMIINSSTTDANVRIETSGMSDVLINGSLSASTSAPASTARSWLTAGKGSAI